MEYVMFILTCAALSSLTVAPWLAYWKLRQIEEHVEYLCCMATPDEDEDDPDPGEEVGGEHGRNIVALAAHGLPKKRA